MGRIGLAIRWIPVALLTLVLAEVPAPARAAIVLTEIIDSAGDGTNQL